jgi:hypothetical protein
MLIKLSRWPDVAGFFVGAVAQFPQSVKEYRPSQRLASLPFAMGERSGLFRPSRRRGVDVRPFAHENHLPRLAP